MTDNATAKKTVVVTGAGSGIGLATARMLSDAGYKLALHAFRHPEKIAELFRESGDLRIYSADLTDLAALRAFAAATATDFGAIYGLVNIAGDVFGPAPADAVTEEAWDGTFALNAKAPYFLFQALCRHFDTAGARVIHISSIGVRYGGSQSTLHYSAAKGALEVLTTGLARWGAPRGILVNSIRPGFIDTDLHERLGRTPEEIENRVRMIPLKRMGRPEEVAAMIEYLLSDSAAFITGQTFTVSGGD